ncbi:MAG TPA: hypothetical protein DC042_14085 [Bacteroidales bacterium]|nr:hypothetical protein [Bacteroidales bacterium]
MVRFRDIACSVVLLICSGLTFSCERQEETGSKPVIQVTVSPLSGNTTQVFSFDMSRSESLSDRSSKLFCRWDWDGDGTWDTPLTRQLKHEHRYYAPGTWHTRAELVNVDGVSDTAGITMQIARGYTPPAPILVAQPDKGHIYTRFLLDASRTRDDEDSLNQLKFRWDFEGDDIWDTGLTDSVLIHHVYPESGFYNPRLEVSDPSGRTARVFIPIEVNLKDPRLLVTFKCIPDSVTFDTPIRMDATGSTDLDHPDKGLMYRWDWQNDWIWDTEWLRNPVIVHSFPEDVFANVRLEVKSYRGLVNDTLMKIRLYHKNQSPKAMYSVSTLSGNINTRFILNAWSSLDQESSPSALLFRWDYNGDGQWDTDFSHEVVQIHQYDSPGTYETLLMIQDPFGETDTYSKTIYVSNGKNITGIFEDKRGYSYVTYGTVLIGKQWWFTRNLSVQEKRLYPGYFYDNQYDNYYDYGNLYELRTLKTLCPAGWRVPSRVDWETLFANYSPEQLYEALMPGGDSDFSAVLGGMGIPIDPYTADCHGLNQYGYYWSTSQPASSPLSNWTVTFDYARRKVLRGFDSNAGKLYSVRCIKDAD